MRKIKMCALADLPEGKFVEKKILARKMAVINYKGQIIGIESECKHQKASLCNGKLEDNIIICPWHGWKYDIISGECITDRNFRLKHFEVEITDGDIYLIF